MSSTNRQTVQQIRSAMRAAYRSDRIEEALRLAEELAAAERYGMELEAALRATVAKSAR